METLLTFARDFTRGFRIADAIDIAIIAVILYSALVWFREAASRQVVVGVSALGIVYFLARTFDLYLTAQLLHAGFAVLLIMLVVIFQEDLRRALERIAAMGSLRSLRHTPPPISDLDSLVQAAFGLAGQKVGALVVVKGRDELQRHLQGGIPLDGRLSKPLIDSIFDPHTAGHDGAAIVAGGRMALFAAHLPISDNRSEIGTRGTRHAAALGLSERCDALVIVVSEERGTISIASGGRLRVVNSPAELKQRLERFIHAKYPERTESWLHQLLMRHAGIKALSAALAVMGWFMFAYNPSIVQRTFLVPIECRNVPAELELSKLDPAETTVIVSGTEPAFQFLDPETLRIGIDLSRTGEGFHRINIEDWHLRLPSSLKLYRIEHGSIFVELRRRMPPANGRPAES